jgi:hypothetical protein
MCFRFSFLEGDDKEMIMKKLLYAIAATLVLAPFGVARADDEDPSQNPARQKAVAWIKENNRYGVDAQIVTDMTEVIDKAVTAKENFALSFGERLLSGGSPVQLASWDNELLVIPLTARQAREMDLKESSVNLVTNKSHAKRDPAPVANVQSIKFNDSSHINGSKPITGELTCQITGAMPDKAAVRVSYFKGSAVSSTFAYPDNLKGNGAITVKFTVSPVNSQSDTKKQYGPLPVFVDLCTIKEEGGNVNVRVISNSIAEVININRPSP